MKLKNFLKLIGVETSYASSTIKVDLWNADKGHQDLLVNILAKDIPTKYLNCEIEENNGFIAKEQNYFIISIHTN